MKMKNRKRYLLLAIFFVLSFSTYPIVAGQPMPPPQPESGPGGSNYLHAEVTTSGPFWAEDHSMDDNFRYFLYEPSAPKPATAPVVLFLHGLWAYSPDIYLEWINHIVRKGYTVVWAQYDDGSTLPPRFPDHVMETWKDALERLESEDHVRPEIDGNGEKKTAVVGHSLGAYLGAVLAAKSADSSNAIPIPYAIVAIEPGGRVLIPTMILEDIDPATKMIIVVGDEDRLVCTDTATYIWEETSQIPDENRDYLLVLSDYNGSPPLVADHLFPTTATIVPRDILSSLPDSETVNWDAFFPDSSEVIDARDFFVTFKLSVGALNCAFYGTDCRYALGNGTDVQVSMGYWSDGQPVTPMTWIEDPSSIEAKCRGFYDFRQPVDFPLSFSEVAPQGFGDRHNSKAWSMIWWKGHLYVGTARAHMCVEYAGLAEKVGQPFFYPPNDPDMECTPSSQDLPLQGEIWRYEPITRVWKRVFQSPNDVEIPEHPGKFTSRDAGFRNIVSFTGPDGTEALYAAGVTSEAINPGMPPPRILRSTDGENWQPVPQDPGTLLGDLGRGQANFRAMEVYKGRLFLVNADLRGGGRLLEAENPAGGNDNFRVVTPEDVKVYELAVFNGHLYIGTDSFTGDEIEGFAVAKTDATGEPPYTFTTIVEKGGYRERFPSNSVVSMFVFKDALYVGTDKPAEMVRIKADDSWDLIVGSPREMPDGSEKKPLSRMTAGFDDILNEHIWRMVEHRGILYVGTNDVRGFIKEYRFAQPFLDNMGYDLAASAYGNNYIILTRTGFDDPLGIGIRVFASTAAGLFFGTSNPFYGLRIYKSNEPIRVLIETEPKQIEVNKARFWVAILTTSGAKGEPLNLDATTMLDRKSLSFGPLKAIPEQIEEKDWDEDGDLDLVLQFKTSETGVQRGHNVAFIEGETVNAQPILGTDSIEGSPLQLQSTGCFISVLW